MSFISIKRDLSNEPLYWIGKVYYNLITYGFYTERKQVVKAQAITPPRTNDFREVETFNRLISKRVYDFITVTQNTVPVANSSTDWTYWVGRRQPWQLGLSRRSQQ
jgi:hypothetical protein